MIDSILENRVDWEQVRKEQVRKGTGNTIRLFRVVVVFVQAEQYRCRKCNCVGAGFIKFKQPMWAPKT